MKLAYDRAGQGSPLLFIHAGIADRRMWGPQLTEMATRFDMVAVDLPGFGDSPAPTEPMSPRGAIAELLDALSIERAGVVGCSYGGSTALDFALEYPGRVHRLALIGAGIGGLSLGEKDRGLFEEIDAAESAGDLDALNEAEIRLWLDGPKRRPGYVGDPTRSLMLRMNGESLRKPEWEGSLMQSLEPPAAGRLGEITAPVLVVVGEYDLPHCHEAADILATSISGARKEVIPDAAHLPSLERPELVNSLVGRFFERR